MKITLRAARVNAGLTQKDAAASLKISNKTLGNWENGVSAPNVKNLASLCALYGVEYDNIIFFNK